MKQVASTATVYEPDLFPPSPAQVLHQIKRRIQRKYNDENSAASKLCIDYFALRLQLPCRVADNFSFDASSRQDFLKL
jgi:hypothetical protein